MHREQVGKFILTDSNNDDVTTAFVAPPALMLARTGAPKPIDESCRLVKSKIHGFQKYNEFKFVV